MEVTALPIALLVNMLMLLAAQIHLNCAQDRPIALIVPTRLQLFEYSALSVNCVGVNTTTGWTVMRRRKGEVGKCVTNWVTTARASICDIRPVYLTDSGEYWCETGGKRSNAVNITVTGAVILESPTRPMMEGEAATLSCRSKMTSSSHIADFFKDGLPIGTGYTGEMTIVGVVKSDEGLYKCSISGFGESSQSWLAVRALHTATHHSSDRSCHVYLVLRTVFTIVMVALLLLIVGLLHNGKLRIA